MGVFQVISGHAEAKMKIAPCDDGTDEEWVDLGKVVEDCAGEARGEERRLRWLASQVIGADAEFISPFGRRRIIYCDHTASGRFMRFIEEYLLTQALPFYGNTHTVDSYVGLHTSELVKQANRYIKRCLGAGSRDVLLFCGSGSTAAIKRLQEVMEITAPPTLRHVLLQTIPLHQRWVVFLGPYEHHSNLLSWRESLADVVEIGLDESGHVDLAALETALVSPDFAGRPKLGSFSACSNVTGVYTDTRAVASLLHRHGAYACFDFACSGPYVEIDMRSGESDGYDAVFISPHKFLGGPGSPGILLMNDELYRLKGLPPSTCGGGTVLYVNGHHEEETLYTEDLEERENAGTPPIVQKLRAALAFAVKSFAGLDLIQRREAAMGKYAMARLAANPKIKVLGLNNEERQPIFSFIIYPDADIANGKHLHCHFTTCLLNDLFGIQARGGCACAGPYSHLLLGVSWEQSLAYRVYIKQGYEGLKPGFTRVSLAYYTSTEEMEFVLDAIEFIAEYGHRFLPLYNFDWTTGTWDYRGDATPLKVSGGGRRIWRRFPHLSGALKRHIPLFTEGKTRRDIAAPPYKEYLRSAQEIAKAMSNIPAMKVLPPEEVQPELVTFMV
ncbi:uncharacterized protein LOC144710129 [Wolffia australiana]